MGWLLSEMRAIEHNFDDFVRSLFFENNFESSIQIIRPKSCDSEFFFPFSVRRISSSKLFLALLRILKKE